MCLNHCFPRYLSFLWYGITKQFAEADARQFHSCCGRLPEAGDGGEAPTPRSPAVLPCCCMSPGRRQLQGPEIQGRECLEAEGGGGRGREGRRGRVQGRTSRLKSQDTDASAFCQQSRAHRNLLPCWQLLLVMEVGCSPSSPLQMFLLPWQEHPNTSSKWDLSCSGG